MTTLGFYRYLTFSVSLDLFSFSKVTLAAGYVLALSSLHLVSITTLGEDQIHTMPGLEYKTHGPIMASKD